VFSLNRRLPILVSGLVIAALLASCADKGSSPSIAAPNGPALGYSPIHGCDFDPNTATPTCTGSASVDTTLWEQLVVCKYYTEGTGPDVQINLTANYVQFPDLGTPGPTQGQSNTFTLQAGKCKTLWRNGEYVNSVRSTDTITVSESPVPGYTTQSQLIKIIRDQPDSGSGATFTLDTLPVSSATTIKTAIGGARIPGAQVIFTNTKVPPPPPPASCTYTQGYWKNHESAWPAPYSATAPWLDATTHKVGNVTWDGLLGLSVAGGNSYLQLAHQWIAATLNAAGGTPVSPAAAAALASAGTWLQNNTPSGNTVPFIKNSQANGWATTLDQYNNGLLGNPHCE